MKPERNGTLCVELEPAANSGTASETGPDYLDELVQATGCRPMREPARSTGVVLGTLAAWDDAGNPLVDFPGNPWSCFLAARSTVSLNQAAVGMEVALLFVEGDLRRPLVVGLVQTPAGESREGQKPLAAEVDGERLVFTADKEIVFRCGEASITLTRAGKVLIRGAYLLSRSSGVNRIKGGSVQIN
jgi:Domain of unknown function (DUF6484)